MSDAAEKSVAAMIGASFTGTTPVAATPISNDEAYDVFEFGPEFQTKIAAFVCMDDTFMRKCGHLIRPEYFENIGEAALVNIALRHHQRYGSVPDLASMTMAVREDAKAGVIRNDALPLVVAARKVMLHTPLVNGKYALEKVVEFIRYQAVSKAILKSVTLLGQKRMPEILESVKAAIDIGANEEGSDYNYFGNIDERTADRIDVATGKRPPKGITTGVMKMDELLLHRGWGRKELSSIMGAAKAGKSTALLNFARSAALAKHNVLYVTLEMSARIAADRLDASLTSTLMKDLTTDIHKVREQIEQLEARSGKLFVQEYASGTLTPNGLRKLIERYKSPGRDFNGTQRDPVIFDLIVVDYADIMAPDFRTQDAIENSKSVYIDLRAIAFEENCAVLTATQTNREGAKKAVATMTDVSEDFNKVRTVDLMISLNRTEEEARRGEARMYFAASRNQESGFTIVIKQNLSMMQFVTSVLRVE